jgi:hypothetical protein
MIYPETNRHVAQISEGMGVQKRDRWIGISSYRQRTQVHTNPGKVAKRPAMICDSPGRNRRLRMGDGRLPRHGTNNHAGRASCLFRHEIAATGLAG